MPDPILSAVYPLIEALLTLKQTVSRLFWMLLLALWSAGYWYFGYQRTKGKSLSNLGVLCLLPYFLLRDFTEWLSRLSKRK